MRRSWTTGRTGWVAVAAGVAASLVGGAVASCGGTGGSTATGGDAATLADVGVGVGSDAGVVPPAVTDFCQKTAAFEQSCNFYGPLGAACASALYAQATSEAGIASCAAGTAALYAPSYVAFETECGFFSLDCSCLDGTCTDAAAPAQSAYYACLDDKIGSLTPTAAALKLKADVCATCPPSDAGQDLCTTFFTAGDGGGAGSAGTSGLLLFSDSELGLVDQFCTGAALVDYDAGGSPSCSPGGFIRCVGSAVTRLPDGGVVDAAGVLPAACQGDGG